MQVQTKRQWLRMMMFLAACIATLVIGVSIFEEKKYAFISVGLVVLACLFLVFGFDKRRTHIRRLVLIAVMTALSVIGRFFFAAIPGFKPMTALIVLTGMYLGCEAGFLCGALTAVLSNFYFGQGPWTPFQMLAWGLIGLFAGFISDKLKKSKLLLLFYGVLSGVFFSLVMDIWTVLWYDGSFNVSLYIAAFMTALPHTVLYSISNFIFLWFAAKPFGAKLERIKIKYGV